MHRDPSAPADTRSMNVVHSALRRDFARARLVLAAPHDQSRYAAVGRHLLWLIEFLDGHHSGEDAVIWPELLRRDPALADLLDRMIEDHRRVEPRLEALRDAARVLAAGTTTPTDVVCALDALTVVLLPHLAVEEQRTMAEVTRLLTNAEWDALENEAFTIDQSTIQMAMHGHWLIDGQTPEMRQRLLSIVPPALAAALLIGFAVPYARQRHAIWGDSAAVDIPALPADADPRPRRPRFGITPAGEVTVVVPATPDQVWTVLADPTRVGEWSHEAVGAVWLDGAIEAFPGARFKGTSRLGKVSWSKTCFVDDAIPGRRFAFHTPGTQWSYDLEPVEGGTLVRQRFLILKFSRLEHVGYWLTVRRHRDRSGALLSDLTRLGEAAGRISPISRTPTCAPRARTTTGPGGPWRGQYAGQSPCGWT